MIACHNCGAWVPLDGQPPPQGRSGGGECTHTDVKWACFLAGIVLGGMATFGFLWWLVSLSA